MPWVEATFKDGKVWAEVDTEGRLVERGGRVAVRYSPAPERPSTGRG
ncbi:MAG: hypothetical protein IPG17_29725 [Sandaracinaceae bacterium]|nr:hypothetical protein [Sandaracinaceae bacterium]